MRRYKYILPAQRKPDLFETADSSDRWVAVASVAVLLDIQE